MAITKDNTEKILRMFDSAFKRGQARTYDRQPDGGFARIAATVDDVSKDQIIELARIASEVPNQCHIRRSGTQVTVYFA